MRSIASWAALCVAVSLLGCHGDDAREASQEAQCPDFELSTTSAAPLEVVTLTSSDPDWQPTLTWFDGSRASPLEAFATDEGAFFSVPLHRNGLSGGAAMLTVGDGCSPVAFEVEALVAADGESAQLMEVLRQAADRMLEDVGLRRADAESLVALDQDGLKIEADEWQALPLLALWALDHPSNPASLARKLEQMPRSDRQVFDAVVARQGLVEDARALAGIEPARWVEVAGPSPGGLSVATKPKYEKVGELAAALTSANGQCAKARVMSKAGVGAALAGVPANLWKPAEYAVLSFSTLAFVLGTHSQWVCATRPYRLTGIATEPESFEFEEDFEGTASFDWIRLRASSGDAISLPETMLSALLQGAAVGRGVVGLPKDPAKGWKFANEFRDSGLKGLGEFLTPIAVGGATSSDEFGKAGGWSWTVDAEDSLYVSTAHTAVDGPVVHVRPCAEGMCLKPLRVGNDALNVFAKPDEFAGQTVGTVVALSVKPIVVFLGPFARAVRPGATVDIGFTVGNAVYPDLLWEVLAKGAAVPDTFETKELDGVTTLATPSAEEDYPVEVKVTATSVTGLREPTRHPTKRVATTILVPGYLVIGPRGHCVAVGEQLQLEASVAALDGQTYEVTWLPSDLVTSEGVFSAPEMEGVYKVEAKVTYSGGTTAGDWMNIRVGGCDCVATFQTVGSAAIHQEQRFGMTILGPLPVEDGVYRFVLEVAPEDNQPFGQITWDTAEPAITSGTFPAQASTVNGVIYVTDGASVVIERREDGSFRGVLTGMAGDGQQPDPDIWVAATFEAWDDLDATGGTSFICKSETLRNAALGR